MAIRSPIVGLAFTIIEILIVVTILGILAGIVVPKYMDAATQSKASDTLSTLQTAREQILIYQAAHKQVLPTLSQLQNSWSVLMQATDADGNVGTGTLGPYLRVIPVNPFTNSSTVAASGSGAATDGWEYDAATGTLNAVGFNEQTQTYTAPSGSSINVLQGVLNRQILSPM